MAAKKKKDGIVGYFLHTFHENGDINWQGRILGREGDSYIVQLLWWMFGHETNCVLIHRDVVADHKKCRLYEGHEEWVHYGEQESKRSSERRERETQVCTNLG